MKTLFPLKPRAQTLVFTLLAGTLTFNAVAAPVKGGTLIYLEQQAHTNLYPPAGGFYPNGGILNQITDKLTWQNPETLQVEPWIAESWDYQRRQNRIHI
ncbi:ABC transporter substrate binding protein, KPN_01854 family [Pantoea agglomerans]|uniref:ABC transporter substrate binding protein, KPN_01854 family n=1 Tax=Enterobacter agglomerans TaxID=549 RepID=A0A379LQI5_ENTAG|nr:ABC transporter substrate binding protein, KPN_01854 family [Pantoea agglomerans]